MVDQKKGGFIPQIQLFSGWRKVVDQKKKSEFEKTTFLEPLFYTFLEQWLQNKWSMGILEMDFERILSVPFFIVVLTPSCCVFSLVLLQWRLQKRSIRYANTGIELTTFQKSIERTIPPDVLPYDHGLQTHSIQISNYLLPKKSNQIKSKEVKSKEGELMVNQILDF